jgi:putative Mn2+ efflux pump MntP
MMIVGVVLLISAGVWWLIKGRSNAEDSSQSQLPAEKAEANYSVPPSIGVSVDNTGGVNFPMGESGFTYTVGQAQSLPTT